MKNTTFEERSAESRQEPRNLRIIPKMFLRGEFYLKAIKLTVSLNSKYLGSKVLMKTDYRNNITNALRRAWNQNDKENYGECCPALKYQQSFLKTEVFENMIVELH